MLGKRSTGYSASGVTFTVAGFDVTKGLGKETFLEIEQEGEDVTYEQGLDGEGVFSFGPSGPTRVKLTLLQTSAQNQVLSALHVASKAAGGIMYPIGWDDRKGTSKGIATSGAITKWPGEKFGKAADEIVWEFLLHDPDRLVGGH